MRFVLPPTDDAPARPNVPVLRHITYDEIHAFQLGLAGLPIGAAYAEGLTEIAVWFTIALLGVVFGLTSLVESKVGGKLSDDDAGAISRDVIAREPWYFLTSYFAWAALGIVLARNFFPPPPLPGTLTASILSGTAFVLSALVAVRA